MSIHLDMTFHSAAVATSNGEVAGVHDLAVYGVQVEGIAGDTITFEGTIDGTTWYSLLAIAPATGVRATTATADGLYIVPVAGLSQLRCRISTYSAGSITVTGRGCYAPYTPMVTTALA